MSSHLAVAPLWEKRSGLENNIVKLPTHIHVGSTSECENDCIQFVKNQEEQTLKVSKIDTRPDCS